MLRQTLLVFVGVLLGRGVLSLLVVLSLRVLCTQGIASSLLVREATVSVWAVLPFLLVLAGVHNTCFSDRIGCRATLAVFPSLLASGEAEIV